MGQLPMRTLLTILFIGLLGTQGQVLHAYPDTAVITFPMDTVTIKAVICQCGAVVTGGGWTQSYGAVVTIPNPKANNNLIKFKTAGSYAFVYTVTAMTGPKVTDTVKIKVFNPPIIIDKIDSVKTYYHSGRIMTNK